MFFQFSSILLLVVVASQELRACFVAPYLNKSRRDDNSCLSRPQSYRQQGSDFARASVPRQKKSIQRKFPARSLILLRHTDET